MREILFKAKRFENNEWVQGFLFWMMYDGVNTCCIGCEPIHGSDYGDITGYWYMVDEETVCQYTGINDKYGKPIFENDIVTIENTKKQGLPGVIVYNRLSASFELAREGYNSIQLDYFEDGKSEFVVVGNIHDKGE